MENAFRQLEERSLSAEVLLMCWSPRMDLMALANVNAEVLLQRLTWQKQPVWILPAPASEEANKRVSVLSWRLDGKVLAVGYQCGLLVLCSVENANVLHSVTFGSPITSLQWAEVKEEAEAEAGPEGTKTTDNPRGQEANPFADGSELFLPRLHPLAKLHSSKVFTEDNVEDAKRLKGQKRLNILVVGLEEGALHLYAYGIVPIGEVQLGQVCQQSSPIDQFNFGRVISATVSKDLRTLSVIVDRAAANEDSTSTACLLSLDCILISSRLDELTRFAVQSSKILTFLEYLNATLQSVSEAGEDILLEMETKLTKYAEQKKTEGSVRDELLQLLLWGRASPELQAFLLHELTEKGMKKLGQSVENSYSNIQKLVLKHIHSVGRSLVYHLSQVQGMSLWYDKYGVIGLSPTAIQEAIGAVGSFMLKASELLQVIDTSLKNFKAFFRWLYVVMMRLSEEPVPSALNKVRQRDINFISDFLAENFAEDISDLGESEGDGQGEGAKRSGFTLERVGQYLRRQDLQHPLAAPAAGLSAWPEWLAACPALAGSPLLFQHQPAKSLLQTFDAMGEAIRAALCQPATAVGQSIKCSHMVALFTHDDQTHGEHSKVHPHVAVNQHALSESLYVHTVFMMQPAPTEVIYLVRQPSHQLGVQPLAEAICLHFSMLGAAELNDSTTSQHTARCSQHEILDAAFFDDQTLSVLLQEHWTGPESVSVICQVPLAALTDHPFTPLLPGDLPLDQQPHVSKVDAGPYVSHCRRLENIRASIFAVSGSRKVACVLFSNHRRVRLFDLDAEDDGEEESMSERSLLGPGNAVVSSEELLHDDRDSNKENIQSPR